MNNSNVNKLADNFYKAAKVPKPATKGRDSVAKKPAPVAKKQPPAGKGQQQVAKKPATKRGPVASTTLTGDQRIQRSVAMDVFPTPIGRLSSKDLFKHYEQMADRINGTVTFEYFNPEQLILDSQAGDYNASVPVCIVEGGDGIGANPYFWGVDFVPALLIRFCSNKNNPALSDPLSYAKKILSSAGIQLYNYIIAPTDRARNKARSSSYATYIYVALDLDEDHLADD